MESKKYRSSLIWWVSATGTFKPANTKNNKRNPESLPYTELLPHIYHTVGLLCCIWGYFFSFFSFFFTIHTVLFPYTTMYFYGYPTQKNVFASFTCVSAEDSNVSREEKTSISCIQLLLTRGKKVKKILREKRGIECGMNIYVRSSGSESCGSSVGC